MESSNEGGCDISSLHSTILMGEEDLNSSISDQLFELDKYI